jgi:hypothetical protein
MLACIPPWKEREPYILLFFDGVSTLPALIFFVIGMGSLFVSPSAKFIAVGLLTLTYGIYMWLAGLVAWRQYPKCKLEYTGISATVVYGLVTLNIPGKLTFAAVAATTLILSKRLTKPDKYGNRPSIFFGVIKIALTLTYAILLFFGLSWYPQALSLANRWIDTLSIISR